MFPADPETSQRTLEEIDLIFAKGYVENINYVHAAQQLPRMNEAEVKAKLAEYRMLEGDEEVAVGGEKEKGSDDEEKESIGSR